MHTRSTIGNISGGIPAVNEDLLSARKAAARLGVSPSWLYQSDVPRVKLGRRTLYRPSDLTKYVDARVSHRVGLEVE